MIKLLVGYMTDRCIHRSISAIKVAIVARKIAAGNLNANTVTSEKDMAGRPQHYFDLLRHPL